MISPQARWPNWSQRACFFWLGLLLLTGCFNGGERADLVIINGREPESLDPAIISAQADGRIVQTLFEGLTRYNPVDATAEPGLAERWDVSADGRIYTFHIRANAKWSNGEAITAHDFVYSWLRVLHPDTAADCAGNLYYIKGAEDYNNGQTTDTSTVAIKALDDHTLRVELVNPTPFFLELCAYATQAIVHKATVEKYGDRWLQSKSAPTSGAYELVSWRLNDRVRVRKNTNYWDAANTQLGVVDFLPVTLASTALNLYDTHQADVIWDKDLVPSEILDLLLKRPDFHSFTNFASYFMRMNTTRKPFHDARVRKAFSMSIDRQRLVEKVTRGGETPANFLVPNCLPFYQSPEGLGYDVEQARKLLAEAGYPNGEGFPRIEYTFSTGRDHEKIAVEMKDMWKKALNVDVGLRAVEFKVWLRLQSALDYDLIRSSWVGDYSDPNTFLDLFMSNNPNNRTGWKNAAYDELIRRANSLPDRAARVKLLRQAERVLIAEEAPIAPLYVYNGFNFWDPKKIGGIHMNIRDEHPIHAIRRIAPRDH
jgi:oligopeptide transport system substrate-binding protein